MKEWYCHGMRYRLLLLSLLVLPVAASAATDDPPLCERENTQYEGWYDDSNRLIRYDTCDNCRAICRSDSRTPEGWYDSCDNSLIQRTDCSDNTLDNNNEDDPPLCQYERTGNEGWYDDRGRVIRYDTCDNCRAICRYGSTTSEGWYDSCDNSLIVRTDCSDTGSSNSDERPMCEREDTQYEGWYDDDNRLIRYDSCDDCRAICRTGSGLSEGWYDSCDNSLIARADCSDSNNSSYNNYNNNNTYTTFRDVPERHPYADAIERLVEDNLLKGYANDLFRPDRNIVRAEFVKLVVLASEDNDNFNCTWSQTSSRMFHDVPWNAWYQEYLCVAVARGLVEGYKDGTFRPEDPVTLAEAAKILTEAFDLPLSNNGYSDQWWSRYIDTLDDEGALPDNSRAGDRVTRGEAAFMIDALYNGSSSNNSVYGDCYDRYGRYDIDYCDDNQSRDCYDRYGRYDEDLCDNNNNRDCYDRYGRYDEDLCEDNYSYNDHDGYYDSDDRFNCVVSGCNSQLCVDERNKNTVSNCQWQPEYACYALNNARCERQDNGYCAWTMTRTLEQCIDDRN